MSRHSYFFYVVPLTVGLIVWGLCIYLIIVDEIEIWDYWGIGFYSLVFLTFGLHALLIAITLSITFKLGYLAVARGRQAIEYLWPVIAGAVFIGMVPYDFNSVARYGVKGLFSIPLFWVMCGLTCFYLWVRRTNR